MLHILCLDDEQFILDLVTTYLENNSEYIVDTTTSPEEALSLLSQIPYDGIVSDYLMPNMDGIEFLKRVRKNHPKIPFVFLSGHVSQEVVINAINNGADFFLEKDLEPIARLLDLSQILKQGAARYRAEQQVQQSEESFRSIFDNQQPMIIVDADTHAIYNINTEAATLIGLPKEEIIGRLCHNFICQAESGKCPISDLNQDVDHSERILLSKNQGEIPVIKTVKPVKIGGKNFLIESFIDISERKRNLEKIQLTNTILTTLKESSTGGVLVLRNNGELVTSNQRFASILEIDDEFINSSTGDEMHQVISYKLENSSEYLEFVSRMSLNPNEDGRLELLMKNGKTITAHSAPMISQDNTFYGRAWFLRDITIQKKNQESILELSNENQIILDNVPAMIWYKDTKNNFVRVNRYGADIFGIPVEEIEGKTMSDLFPDLAEQYYLDDLKVINSKQPKLGIIEQMTFVSGKQIWIKTDKIPLFDKNGQVSGLLVFAVDITERIIIEETLKKSHDELEMRVQERTAALQDSEEKLQLKLNSLLSPESDISELELINILDIPVIQSMMEDFSRLTGMVTAIVDLNGNVIEASGWQDICSKFHRVNEISAKLCTESDLFLSK
ncbi:MAG: PAS domain S-box protein, partial [Methanobacteriota archaeon]